MSLLNNHYVYTSNISELMEMFDSVLSIVYQSTPEHFIIYPPEGCKHVEFKDCEEVIDGERLPTAIESLTITNTQFKVLDLSRFPRLKYLTIHEGWLPRHSLKSSQIVGWEHARSLLDLTVHSESLYVPAKTLELPHIERVNCLKLDADGNVFASSTLTHVSIGRLLSSWISFDQCAKLQKIRLQLPDLSRLRWFARHINNLQGDCEGQFDAHTNDRPYTWEYSFKKIHGDTITLWQRRNPLSLGDEFTPFTFR